MADHFGDARIQQRTGEFNDGLFYALPSLVGGLLVYNYYATGLSPEGRLRTTKAASCFRSKNGETS